MNKFMLLCVRASSAHCTLLILFLLFMKCQKGKPKLRHSRDTREEEEKLSHCVVIKQTRFAVKSSLGWNIFLSQIKVAFDWNKLWFYYVYIAKRTRTYTHKQTRVSVGCLGSRWTRHKQCSMVCPALTRRPSLSTNPLPILRITTKWTSETNNYFSPISRIRLFLLIPRTWPLWKFNISCYCRCFMSPCSTERARRISVVTFMLLFSLFTHVETSLARN